MENTFTKTSLYFVFFVTVTVTGYIVGLITFPTQKPIEAIRESTISLLDSYDTQNNHYANNQELPELPVVSVQEDINPFNGNNNNKVINMPSYRNQQSNNQNNNLERLKSDPRVTIIPRNDSVDGYNPMGSSSDKVEIEITGEEPLSEIEKKNLIDDLSVMTNKKPEKQNNTPDTTDPYAPRMPLMPAPIKGYYEQTKYGFLPKTPQGQKPLWQVYRNPTQINSAQKPIAYILGGLGIDYDLTIKAIKTLPPQVTLGFIPYAKDLQALITMARKYGHETILEIPMESHDAQRADMGVLALKTTDTPTEYQNKMTSLLSVATGYSGVMNYLGGKYVLNDTASLGVLNDLKSRGLYFVENKTMRSGILSELAKQNQVPYGASFDIVDEVLTPETMTNRYNTIEKNTQIGEPMIATAYLSPLSLSFLQTRIMLYEKNSLNNIQLIPISSYIEHTQ